MESNSKYTILELYVITSSFVLILPSQYYVKIPPKRTPC